MTFMAVFNYQGELSCQSFNADSWEEAPTFVKEYVIPRSAQLISLVDLDNFGDNKSMTWISNQGNACIKIYKPRKYE